MRDLVDLLVGWSLDPATISQNVLYAVALYKENTRALTFENVPADSLSHRTHAG